ncbi:MAG: tetratricopeptide repeat protein [Pseudomonadota bacterium]
MRRKTINIPKDPETKSLLEKRAQKEQKQAKPKPSEEENFLNDVKNLLELRKKLVLLDKITDNQELGQALIELGDLAKKFDIRQKHKGSIRNRYSSQVAGASNILDLNILERLEFLDLTKEANLTLLQNSRSEIIADLQSLVGNIDYILTSAEKERIEKITDLDQTVWQEIVQISPTKTKPESGLKIDGAATTFIASFYLPLCLEKMIAALEELKDKKFAWKNSRLDRYYFARMLVDLGEISRGVRYVVPKGEQETMFKNFNYIRNYIKTIGGAHLNIFVEGIKNNFAKDYSEFDKFLKEIPDLIKNLKFIKDGIEQAKTLPEQQDLLKKPLEKKEKILKDLSDCLKGKNPVESELKGCLNKIGIKLSQIEKMDSNNVFDPTEYQSALAEVSEEDKKNFSFPSGEDLAAIQDFKMSNRQNKSKKNPEAIALMQIIKSLQDKFPTQAAVKKSQDDLAELYQKYDALYQNIPENYKNNFPHPNDKEAIKLYYQKKSSEQKASSKNDDKDDEEPQLKITDQKVFERYCQDYISESKRLAEILAVKAQTDDEKKRKLSAIQHSFGILGEAARMILEANEDHKFLAEYPTWQLEDDLYQTAQDRNALIHRVFAPTKPDISQTIYRRSLPSLVEIEALSKLLKVAQAPTTQSLFEEGQSYCDLKRYDRAFERFEQMLASAEMRHKSVAEVDLRNLTLQEFRDYYFTPLQAIFGISKLLGDIAQQELDAGDKESSNNFYQLKASYLRQFLKLADGFFGQQVAEYLPFVAGAYNNLASTCSYLEDFDGALENYQKALEIIKRFPDAPAKNIALYLYNVGAAYHRDLMGVDLSANSKKVFENIALKIGCLWEAKEIYRQIDQKDSKIKERYAMCLSTLIESLNYSPDPYHPLYAEELFQELESLIEEIPHRESSPLFTHIYHAKNSMKHIEVSPQVRQKFQDARTLIDAEFEIERLNELLNFYISLNIESGLEERLIKAREVLSQQDQTQISAYSKLTARVTSLISQGAEKFKQNNFPLALEFYESALKKAEESESEYKEFAPQFMPDLISSLLNVAVKLEDRQRAEKYLEKLNPTSKKPELSYQIIEQSQPNVLMLNDITGKRFKPAFRDDPNDNLVDAVLEVEATSSVEQYAKTLSAKYKLDFVAKEIGDKTYIVLENVNREEVAAKIKSMIKPKSSPTSAGVDSTTKLQDKSEKNPDLFRS